MKGLTKRLTAAILLAAVCLTANVYSRTRSVELRLGFMAGSYWDAPNGNCYAVIDAAIERFEREHPNVRVTYTSGILKRDYSEWLIDQYLLGLFCDGVGIHVKLLLSWFLSVRRREW